MPAPSNNKPQQGGLASPYVKRILLVALLMAGGFTLMCFTGWWAVAYSHPQDSWGMLVFRWLFPVIGAAMVGGSFVLLNRPVGNVWEEFEASSDDEDADGIVSNMDGR